MTGKKIDITALPTAPRSVRGANVDLARVPTKPPFKAFLGNLSYDVSVNDIEKFFKNLKVCLGFYCDHMNRTIRCFS